MGETVHQAPENPDWDSLVQRAIEESEKNNKKNKHKHWTVRAFAQGQDFSKVQFRRKRGTIENDI